MYRVSGRWRLSQCVVMFSQSKAMSVIRQPDIFALGFGSRLDLLHSAISLQNVDVYMIALGNSLQFELSSPLGCLP